MTNNTVDTDSISLVCEKIEKNLYICKLKEYHKLEKLGTPAYKLNVENYNVDQNHKVLSVPNDNYVVIINKIYDTHKATGLLIAYNSSLEFNKGDTLFYISTEVPSRRLMTVPQFNLNDNSNKTSFFDNVVS